MSGDEFVRQYHADPAFARVPVIFYTATYREREANRIAFDCGVRWVLAKPSDPELILVPSAHSRRRLRRGLRPPAAW